MLKALERNVASVSERMVLLAPSTHSVSNFFKQVEIDSGKYHRLVQDVQRFRGSIYLQDGAIAPSQLSDGGLHQTPEDDKSWHLLLLNKQEQVKACVLYREHENTVGLDDLKVRHTPLAQQDEWSPKLWKAIKNELARARRDDLQYVEVGGWAVAPELRRTAGPLTIPLAIYGLSRRHGGALGMTTATFRHCSAVILQRLGCSRFEVDGVTLPPYYDPRYECMMELLRFDSREPNPRYVNLIDRLREQLAEARVVTRSAWTSALTVGEASVRAPIAA